MNRYDVFRLVQELGQLIEGAHDKALEEVARELIACGQRRLAEAKVGDSPNHSMNGTAIPSLLVETAAILGPANATPSAVTSAAVDAARA